MSATMDIHFVLAVYSFLILKGFNPLYCLTEENTYLRVTKLTTNFNYWVNYCFKTYTTFNFNQIFVDEKDTICLLLKFINLFNNYKKIKLLKERIK